MCGAAQGRLMLTSLPYICRVAQSGGGILIWVGISNRRCTQLHVTLGKLNAVRYCDEILRSIVLLFVCQNNTIYLHDNDKHHFARVGREFLGDENVRVLDWAAYSRMYLQQNTSWTSLIRQFVADIHSWRKMINCIKLSRSSGNYPTPGCENQWIWAVVSKGVDTTGPNLHIGYNTLICISVARRACVFMAFIPNLATLDLLLMPKVNCMYRLYDSFNNPLLNLLHNAVCSKYSLDKITKREIIKRLFCHVTHGDMTSQLDITWQRGKT